MFPKRVSQWSKFLAGGVSGLTALVAVTGHAELMSPRTTPVPKVSPATLSGHADQQPVMLVRKMMLAPPPAIPATLLDAEQIVRGEQPLMNLGQFTASMLEVPLELPLAMKQASNTRIERVSW